MNLLVLVIAGVFVVAGLVLIVLSFLVGRSGVKEGSPEAPLAAEAAETSAFIDEPLATDISEQLERKKKVAPAAEPVAETSAISEAQAASAGPSEQVPAATAASGAAVGAAATPSEGDAQGTALVANQVGFNFRVQLGFKFLQNGLYQDGVNEFQKALALTDDRDAKLKLYVEIGNAFRTQGMRGPAAAAYTQATAYTDNAMLLEHLERTIADMMGTED